MYVRIFSEHKFLPWIRPEEAPGNRGLFSFSGLSENCTTVTAELVLPRRFDRQETLGFIGSGRLWWRRALSSEHFALELAGELGTVKRDLFASVAAPPIRGCRAQETVWPLAR